jgi:pyrimidine-nucleoside phosphorylase
VNFLSLIEAKRDGRALSPDQIAGLIAEYTAGQIHDYQMAAFLMAVYFRGMDANERRALTLAMRDSGEVLQFPADPRPVVDKHSTGGVGDNVSLPLTPLLACLGFRVPMVSGRGLGITGGTLDKLESIPGFTTALTTGRIVEQVQAIGCAMCGQTERMVPADKRLYALRDVTGTVASIPLITASILSKKLAENLVALALDVKFGCAAFMPNRGAAAELAEAMVSLGTECGVPTRALLTAMNSPLGRSAGNWLEVKESVACLAGRGPDDLRELVIEFAAHLLVQTGRAQSLALARPIAAEPLDSGAAHQKWHEMLAAQGADLEATARLLEQDHTAPVVRELAAPEAGWVVCCDARIIGEVIRDLGGGRLTKESVLRHDVGVDALAKPGERVERNGVLLRVHAGTPEDADLAVARLREAVAVGPEPIASEPLIAAVIDGG